MDYEYNEKYTQMARDLAVALDFKHIDLNRISVVIGRGSKTRRTIARIHAMPKAIQIGMNINTFYVIELIWEKFQKESDEEKIKTIIHELMHIPKNFGGGFRHHDQVTKKNVDIAYDKYLNHKQAKLY